MSAAVKSILQEVKSRLQSTGWTLISGRHVDATTDTLPAATFFFHPDKGIGSNDDDLNRGPVSSGGLDDLYLVVEVADDVSSPADALIELEDIHDTVKTTLFPNGDRLLGDLARSEIVVTERQSFMPPDSQNVGKIQMTLKIPYVEDY